MADKELLEAIAEDVLLVTWDKDYKFNFSQVVRLMAEFVMENPVAPVSGNGREPDFNETMPYMGTGSEKRSIQAKQLAAKVLERSKCEHKILFCGSGCGYSQSKQTRKDDDDEAGAASLNGQGCSVKGCQNKVAQMRQCLDHLPGNFPPEPLPAPPSEAKLPTPQTEFDMEFARKVKVIGERYNWNFQAFFAANLPTEEK